MQTLSEVKKRLLINLQDYPEIAIRYQNCDPRVVAMINAQAGFIVDQSRDIEIAKIEPFIKSNERTILADATNKGILPIATPCQAQLEIENTGTDKVSISAGRYFEDIQGRTWRFLQNANIDPKATAVVLVEQSQIRKKDYQVIFTEDFHLVELELLEDMFLSSMHIKDDAGNIYKHYPSWLNCAPMEYAFNLKTDSQRKLIIQFGDDLRCGSTLKANTVVTFELTETDGYIDSSALREASLNEIVNNAESKLKLKFKEGGLVRAGADPLSIEQLRVLSSYPIYDESAVFLSNFDFSVRKAFMARCHYITVWNEAMQDKYYVTKFEDINHLQLAFEPKNEVDRAQLAIDIKQYIARNDSLYEDRVHEHVVEHRHFKIEINAKLAPVHNVEAVKEQIIELLISRYGKDSLASSYFLADGFNTQEIADLLKKNISAFQDHISDFSLAVEDLIESPIKPHQWTYFTRESISINAQRTALTGTTLWTA